ncbi:hypothetical protein BCR35DRAFT_265394 [Leucosporidium creatinivorum]|uniref:Mediator of RNA polymerase II transcription subunit 18 n=1 Tax=Leucosporidium creatinivorum TaxID=106004 RepID=A0A1Y2FG71_9BASI|nr:hypothetical protein BCR35DRAFT_265394 [Leucosporidium creatinivorum]
MASTQLSLLGQLPLELHTALLERLSAQAEQGEAYSMTESVHHRSECSDGSATVPDESVLRLRAVRTSQSDKTAWTMTVLQKPEPARLSPTMLQRGVIECAIEEGCHPKSLASAFGFSTLAFITHQKGVRFQRGAVLVDIYQLFDSPTAPEPFDPSTYTVSVTTRCANPTRTANNSSANAGPSAQELKAVATAAMIQMSASLKGLVDLSRVE